VSTTSQSPISPIAVIAKLQQGLERRLESVNDYRMGLDYVGDKSRAAMAQVPEFKIAERRSGFRVNE
jgi:hypothetical protein